MGRGDAVSRLVTRYCSDIKDTIARARCGGYVEQCMAQKVEEGKDPNSTMFELRSEGGKVIDGMDFYECLQFAKLFTANGRPAGFEESYQSEIDRYQRLSVTLQQEIERTEPSSTNKYTRTMNAALDRMPNLARLEQDQALCVAKNKYMMLHGLKRMLLEETRTEHRCEERRSSDRHDPFRRPRHGHRPIRPRGYKKGPHERRPLLEWRREELRETICRDVRVGRVRSKEELERFAFRFCTTRCVQP